MLANVIIQIVSAKNMSRNQIILVIFVIVHILNHIILKKNRSRQSPSNIVEDSNKISSSR